MTTQSAPSITGTLSNVGRSSRIFYPKPTNASATNSSFTIQLSGIVTGLSVALMYTTDEGITWLPTGTSYTASGFYSVAGIVNYGYKLTLISLTKGTLVYNIFSQNMSDFGAEGVVDPVARDLAVSPQALVIAGAALAKYELVNIMDYPGMIPGSVIPDGVTDCTAGIQAAFDYAAANGKGILVPRTAGTFNGFRVRDTIESSVRYIHFELPQWDSSNKGAYWNFDPAVITDKLACLAINAGMYGNAPSCENISLFGPHGNWNMGNSALWCPTPANLPATTAFADGAYGIQVNNDAQPKFHSCRTQSFKAGLHLNSTNGHIHWYNCYWSGVFGVYCEINSEDYMGVGSSHRGLFAGIAFGTTEHFGHWGGFDFTAIKNHDGYSPYCFSQLTEYTYGSNKPSGLYGNLQYQGFEQVGECIYQSLPTAKHTGLDVGIWGFSWANQSGTYNLPSRILATASQQQYCLRLGELSSGVRLGQYSAEINPLITSPYSAVANKALAKIEILDDIGYYGWSNDLSALKDSVTITARTPKARSRRRMGDPLVRADSQAVQASYGNLLKNWLVPANWSAGSPALSDLATVGGTVPQAMYEELGTNPEVITFGAAAANSLCGLVSSTPLGGRYISVTFWARGGSVRARLELASGNLYDTTTSCTEWTKVVYTGQTTASNVNSFLIVPAIGISIAGLMVTFDDSRPAHQYQTPMLQNLTLEGGRFASSGAAVLIPVPDYSHGRIEVGALNGANFSGSYWPYNKVAGTLLIGARVLNGAATGADPVTASAVGAGGTLSVTTGAGTKVRYSILCSGLYA